MDINLTDEEKKVIFSVARKSGLDVDGDILSLYVNDFSNVVIPVERYNQKTEDLSSWNYKLGVIFGSVFKITQEIYRHRPLLARIKRFFKNK